MSLNSCFAFGALISATDPVAVLGIFKELGVDRVLFSLIFGESILNDAISIILFDTSIVSRESKGMGLLSLIKKFCAVFFGSLIIGYLIGMVTAYILKNANKNNQSHHQNGNREITILLLVPWVSYFIADGFGLSGIVSIVFCGISIVRYALPNVTDLSRELTKQICSTMSYNCENIVFLFIGIGLISFKLAWKEMGIWLFLLIFLTINVARFISVYLVSSAINSHRQKTIISSIYQFMMWFSGFRGAMAFALALKAREIFKENKIGDIILTFTLIVSTINIIINATLLLPIIRKCNI